VTTDPKACYFCGDTTPDHKHYTVLCYENGKCLGRLGSDGCTTTRKIRAVIFGKQRAEQVAAEINADGEFTAKVRPF
jgi:hypothetical protein